MVSAVGKKLQVATESSVHCWAGGGQQDSCASCECARFLRDFMSFAPANTPVSKEAY